MSTRPAAVGPHTIDPTSVRRLSEGFCRKQHVVILGTVDPDAHGAIAVGMLDAGDRALAQQLQRFLHRPIEPIALEPAQLQRALDVGFGTWARSPAGPGGRDDDGPITAEALLDDLLEQAQRYRATAIHIDHRGDRVEVRLRVDGRLHAHATPLDPASAHDLRRWLAGEDPGETIPTEGVVARSPTNPPSPQPWRWAAHDADPAQLVLTQPRPDAVNDLHDLPLSDHQRQAVERILGAGPGLVLVAGDRPATVTDTGLALLGCFDPATHKLIALQPRARRHRPGVTHRVVKADDLAAALDHHIGLDPDALLVERVERVDRPSVVQALLRASQDTRVVATVAAPDIERAVAIVRGLGASGAQLASVLRGVVVYAATVARCEVIDAPPPWTDRLADNASTAALRTALTELGVTRIVAQPPD